MSASSRDIGGHWLKIKTRHGRGENATNLGICTFKRTRATAKGRRCEHHNLIPITAGAGRIVEAYVFRAGMNRSEAVRQLIEGRLRHASQRKGTKA